MKLSINKNMLQITPEDKGYPIIDERDAAFIESVLGLKKDGDYIKLVRRDAYGLSSVAYLETERIKEPKNKSKHEIFSGDHSKDFWNAINALQEEDIRDVLYLMGCRLQELERKIFEEE